MKNIIYLFLLLPLVSCLAWFSGGDKIIVDDNVNRVPLFQPRVEIVVDKSDFAIKIPAINYSNGTKVDDMSVSTTISFPITEVISSAIVGENLCVLDGMGRLVCMDRNGNEIWASYISEVNNYGSIFYAGDNLLVVNTGTTRLHGLNVSNGDVVWSKSIKSPVHSRLSKVGQKQFAFITIDNYVYLLNVDDGSIEWSYHGSIASFKRLNLNSPTYYDNKLILPPIENELILIDVKSGDKIWGRGIDTQYKESVIYNSDDSPVVIGDVILVSNSTGKIEAFSLNTGDIKWERYINFQHKPYVLNGLVFGVTQHGEFIALNSEGKVKWLSLLSSGVEYYTPLFINGSLWLFTDIGKALEYDIKTGKQLSELVVPKGIYYQPFVLNGRVYLFVKTNKLRKHKVVILGDLK